jgi:hypothetical protein
MLVEPRGGRVLAWKSHRDGKERAIVATDDFCYVVVLALKRTYALLLTAYHVERAHRRAKLRSEYEEASRKVP